MHPLLSAALFWAILFSAMTLFGIACIKYGVYTSGNRGSRPTLDI
jgi:hypothetical protein